MRGQQRPCHHHPLRSLTIEPDEGGGPGIFFTKKPDLHFVFPCAFYFFFFFFVSGRLGGRQAFGWLFNLVWVAAKIVPFSFVFFFSFSLVDILSRDVFLYEMNEKYPGFFCCVLRLREKKKVGKTLKVRWMDGWMKGWLDFFGSGSWDLYSRCIVDIDTTTRQTD